MYSLKNKVQLIGYLGGDPEVKTVNGDSKLAKFSIATNDSYKNAKGEKVTETQWHHVIAWGRTATFIEKYLVKGIEVVIDGKLINRNYTDKNDIKRYITEVQANDVLIVSHKKLSLIHISEPTRPY